MPQHEDKHAIYQRAQLGHKLGYGQRPAVVVVDFQLGFTTPERSPLAGNLDAEVAATNKIIAVAHQKNVPVMTFLRGASVMENGEITGQVPTGRFVEQVVKPRGL